MSPELEKLLSEVAAKLERLQRKRAELEAQREALKAAIAKQGGSR